MGRPTVAQKYKAKGNVRAAEGIALHAPDLNPVIDRIQSRKLGFVSPDFVGVASADGFTAMVFRPNGLVRDDGRVTQEVSVREL